MTSIKRRQVILVGAGFAGTTHWIPSVIRSAPFELIGAVDPDERACNRAVESAPGIWTAVGIDVVPSSVDREHAIIFVATPDHLTVIREAIRCGFRQLIVEKPLVSHDTEVDEFVEFVRSEYCTIYSIDHYYQKFLSLELVLARLSLNDPRMEGLQIYGNHDLRDIPGCLGAVEGVTYTNIEAGDLGIPTLDTHPWLEHDPVIGGILRDLGPHAFAPLIRVGLIAPDARIMDVGLAKLTPTRDGFAPVCSRKDVEMYVRALMVWNGITANVTFGKAPFKGKERSLAVRAANGVFFAGLARGQSSVLMTNDGRTTRISLRRTENDLVLEEAIAFFDGRLPYQFDGNLRSSLDALRLSQKLRAEYFYRGVGTLSYSIPETFQ